jgi:hypothetical protein
MLNKQIVHIFSNFLSNIIKRESMKFRIDKIVLLVNDIIFRGSADNRSGRDILHIFLLYQRITCQRLDYNNECEYDNISRRKRRYYLSFTYNNT